MTLNTAILIITGLLFSGCAAAFIKQLIFALKFRRNIAYTHGFSEGILTGINYPAVILLISTIFIQFTSFFIFKANNEFITIIRLSGYALSVLLFFFFSKRTPPLLAYWFGKSAFWENFGEKGKISYNDISCARVSRKVKFPVMNNQQLCKISIYVRGRKSAGRLKKYTCRLTAYELTALAAQVQFHPADYRPEKTPLKKRLPYIILPYLTFFTAVLFTLPIISTGIFCPYRYSLTEFPINEEIKTVTSISEISCYRERLYVYYDNIGAVNVYDTAGNFIYAISFPYTALRKSDFSVSGGYINFRSGDTVYTYLPETGYPAGNYPYNETLAVRFTAPDNSLYLENGDSYYFDQSGVYLHRISDGKNVRLVERAYLFIIFDLKTVWFFIAVLTAVLFTIHYLTCKRPKREKTVNNDPGNDSDDFLSEVDTPDSHTASSYFDADDNKI